LRAGDFSVARREFGGLAAIPDGDIASSTAA
jgi:hypothetical protein